MLIVRKEIILSNICLVNIDVFMETHPISKFEVKINLTVLAKSVWSSRWPVSSNDMMIKQSILNLPRILRNILDECLV